MHHFRTTGMSKQFRDLPTRATDDLRSLCTIVGHEATPQGASLHVPDDHRVPAPEAARQSGDADRQKARAALQGTGRPGIDHEDAARLQ